MLINAGGTGSEKHVWKYFSVIALMVVPALFLYTLIDFNKNEEKENIYYLDNSLRKRILKTRIGWL